MYKELVLKLNKNKPIFTVGDIRCMYDSGARFPVWCASAEALFDYFPNTIHTEYKVPIGGFGGNGKSATLSDVYMIPEFKIHENLTFKNLHAALINDMDFGCDLILSDTIFKKMKVSVNRLNEREPTLEILSQKSEYWLKPLLKYGQDKVYGDMCNFTQQEYFDKCEYLKDHIDTLPHASVEECVTKEDCDKLLERLGLK